MNDVIVRARELTKVYRLYGKPHYRFLDMFGLLRKGEGRYTEHRALDGIDLEIRRGEKVAIIGRNGAGKSTLLKLATKVIEPTSGSIEVAEGVHALLQIGSGFHPEFSGRENARSYLAHLGVTGSAAEEKIREIVEFSELEEYIDQPIKTYSSGMAARLMFATSTAIVPKLLVLDEILGVGDAYFAQKSYDRIKELCDGGGTTVLLVTHDIYSAMKLCTRFIWLDRGIVKADANGETAIAEYEQSIREQEERRLNLRRIESLKAKRQDSNRQPLFAGLSRRQPIASGKSGLWVSDIQVLVDGRDLGSFTVEQEAAPGRSGIVVNAQEGNWGEPEAMAGRVARRFLEYGSIHHRLPMIVYEPGAAGALEESRLAISVVCFAEAEEELRLAVSIPQRAVVFAATARVAPGRWQAVRFEPRTVTGEARANELAKSRASRYGTRALEFTDVEFLDADGEARHSFSIGTVLRVRLRYRINDLTYRERPIIVVAFQKDGILRSHRFSTDRFLFDGQRRREGEIEVLADPLLLGAGSYLVTVSAFREGYFGPGSAPKFFSANDDVLDMHARAYEIVVEPNPHQPLGNDVVFLHPSRWTLDGGEVADEPSALTGIVRHSRTDPR